MEETGGYEGHAISRFERGRLLAAAKGAELDEDRHVFDNGSQRADEPGEVGEKVLFLDRVEKDLRAVRIVASLRADELTPAP